MKQFNEIFEEVGVITLQKRKQYITSTLKKMNINITTLFDAIIGSTLNRTELIKNGILDKDCKLNDNVVACALSHYNLIKKFYNGNSKNLFVFEDDIEYSSNYLMKLNNIDLPKDYDLINFGHCWNTCYNMIKVSGNFSIVGNGVYKYTNALCTHSYSVSRKGAKIILDNFFPIKDPVDVFIVSIKNDNFYTIYPRIFKQKRDTNKDSLLFSSLNNNDSCQECFDEIKGINIYLIIFYVLVFYTLIYI